MMNARKVQAKQFAAEVSERQIKLEQIELGFKSLAAKVRKVRLSDDNKDTGKGLGSKSWPQTQITRK